MGLGLGCGRVCIYCGLRGGAKGGDVGIGVGKSYHILFVIGI